MSQLTRNKLEIKSCKGRKTINLRAVVPALLVVSFSVGVFLARYAMVRQEDKVGWLMTQALLDSSNSHDGSALEALLKSGVSPNVRVHNFPLETDCPRDILIGDLQRCFFIDKHGWQTPLLIATTNQDRNAVQLLLKNGADPNIPDSSGRVALPDAFGELAGLRTDPSDQIDMTLVRMLVHHRANINHTDGRGRSILSYAVMDLYPDAVKQLLNLGALPTPKVEDSPLEYWHVCPARAKATLTAFAQGGASARGETNNNFTWVQIAIADGSDEAQALLRLGFAPDNTYIPESSIVDAIRGDDLALVPALIHRGANVNAYSNEFNERPIEAASAIHDEFLAEALLSAGAAIDPMNPNDRYAMRIWNSLHPLRKIYIASN